MTESKVAFYEIGSFETGITNTGSRNANYHCWCSIFNEKGEKVYSHLQDVFYGRWTKCEKAISKWRKKCEKEKLTPLNIDKK